MKKQIFCVLAVMMVLVYGCKKEESFEQGNTPSEGSLQSTGGDCLPSSVNGAYVATTPLVPATNTVTVTVSVTKTGNYTIYTDTINGYYFRATGIFTTLGSNTVTLRSNGTPFADGIDNFEVHYDGTVCNISVEVLPAGTANAVYTINCPGVTVQGTYQVGVALAASNTITIPVTAVTTPGIYNITGTINGMTFTGSGNLTAPGNIILTGSGTPTAAATPTSTLALTAPACNIPITVAAAAPPAVFTINCPGVTVQGSYQVGVALTASNTITIPVTAVTTPGSYNISGSINGMTFSGSGNISAPGNIILTGTGTPTAAASPTSTLVLSAPACNIPITVAPGAGPATFTINCAGATVQGTYTVGNALTAANTITIPVATITTPGTYSITTTAVNGMTFTGSGSLTTTPANIVLTGSGTPTASAAPASNIVLPAPFASCTVSVTVGAAPSVDWSFQIGATTYSGTMAPPPDGAEYDVTTQPPFSFLFYEGNNASNQHMDFTIIDFAGGISTSASETYVSTSGTSNTLAWYFYDDAGTIDLTCEPPIPPDPAVGNMTFVITSHNAATKTIIGTFSGTAFDLISGTNKTITNGNFKAVYQ